MKQKPAGVIRAMDRLRPLSARCFHCSCKRTFPPVDLTHFLRIHKRRRISALTVSSVLQPEVATDPEPSMRGHLGLYSIIPSVAGGVLSQRHEMIHGRYWVCLFLYLKKCDEEVGYRI